MKETKGIMTDGWNLTAVEPLDDKNYFLWKEKIEGILRAKKLWKKVIDVKEPRKPEEEEEGYAEKFTIWNTWDNDNHAARAIMINTMTKAQLLRYSNERNADKLWNKIKNNMAAESEQTKARSLSELTSLKMKRDENVDGFINRAEALRNQCTQLGKFIEDYELKMYILKDLRVEFDQNVRILENQRDVTINDIRYALKQEESRQENRKGERMPRDQENIRKAREKSKSEVICYNCGKRGHMSSECFAKQKCYNCQGFGHIASDCKESKGYKPSRGRGQRGRYQWNHHGRDNGRGRGRSEAMMKSNDDTEAVRNVNDYLFVNKTNRNNVKNTTWLLDSGSTSHMTRDTTIFDGIEDEEREITLADKEGRKLVSKGKGEVVMKQAEIENRVRLNNVLFVPDLNTSLLSVAKCTDYGYNVKFDKLGAVICNETGTAQMTAVRRDNAYYVESMIMDNEVATVTMDEDIWHRRLGHINKRDIEEMKKS